MKKLLFIFFSLFFSHAFAQDNPITAINISLPANPDGLISKWATTLSISARIKSGKVDPVIQACRVLVIIKKDGKKIFGKYSPDSAPSARFDGPAKVWNGTNAVELLGQESPLPPGDYELSVQFFGGGNGKIVALSAEATKPFTIKR